MLLIADTYIGTYHGRASSLGRLLTEFMHYHVIPTQAAGDTAYLYLQDW